MLVGDDAHRPCDRPPLSKDFLAGTVDAQDIALLDDEDEADLALGSPKAFGRLRRTELGRPGLRRARQPA